MLSAIDDVCLGIVLREQRQSASESMCLIELVIFQTATNQTQQQLDSE